MRKKVVRIALLLLFVVAVILAVINTYTWIVAGEQYIKISTSSRAYTNSDLYVSFLVQDERSRFRN